MEYARAGMVIETPRLLLRPWRDDDLSAWLAMSQDRDVMAHFPSLIGEDECRTILERQTARIAERGHGFWAVEVRGGEPFIGFCGIQAVTPDMPFAPAFEVGWRLARSAWGHGYATEGGRASLRYGFEQLGLDEIVAFLLPANRASAAVCERLGMTRDLAGDFDHPKVAEGQISVGGLPQRRHALYRLRRADWRDQAAI